jgi:archaeal flagellar protein FlaI
MGFLNKAKQVGTSQSSSTSPTVASTKTPEPLTKDQTTKSQTSPPSNASQNGSAAIAKTTPSNNSKTNIERKEVTDSKTTEKTTNESNKKDANTTNTTNTTNTANTTNSSDAITESKGTTDTKTSADNTLKDKKVLHEQDDAFYLSADELEIKKQVIAQPADEPLRTFADDIFDILQKEKKATFASLAKQVSVPIDMVEKVCIILAKNNNISIRYPLLFSLSPEVTFKSNSSQVQHKYQLGDSKRELDKYVIFSDFVCATVTIWSVPKENTPIYDVLEHQLGDATYIIISEIIDEISLSIKSEFFESSDIRQYYSQKHNFFKEALSHVQQFFTDLPIAHQYMLAGKVLQNSIGLGNLDVVLADNWLEEVAINAKSEPLSVYHKRFGWLKSTILFNNDSEVYNIAIQIGRKVGKQITSLEPIMDAHMQTGDRVAATLFPISTEGDTLTIRRFSRNPWTIVHMIDEKNHTLSKDIMSFMWLAMQYELNLMVVGGTASGKTSVLNTLSSLIPPTNRIISIEDTREISLPNALHWNWVALSSKSPNSEGQGEVSMLDLMVAALRMRPDRIIVGEIRKKAQAEALFEAMHTGHAVSATMHADTSEQIKHRLTQPPIDIPENEIQALQLIMVQYRDRRRGVRRTLEVAELLPGSNDEKVNLNYLYRWRARSDTFVVDEPSIRVTEDLNLHTGMTEKDIQEDLSQKKEVLSWLLQNRIYDIDDVGEVLRIYYKHPKILLDSIRDNGSLKTIVETSHAAQHQERS